MSRVRVTCKAPAAPKRVPSTTGIQYPIINGAMASIADCNIELVDEDGNGTTIPGVTRSSAITVAVGSSVDAPGLRLPAIAVLCLGDELHARPCELELGFRAVDVDHELGGLAIAGDLPEQRIT